jgi:23S rRNA (adenine2030-N6)-methyltransferase
VDGLHESAIEAGFPNILVVEMAVAPVRPDGPLGGSGLLICNPPFTLGRELETVLPALTERLAQSPSAQWRVEWLRQR